MDSKTDAQTVLCDYFTDDAQIPPRYTKIGTLQEVDEENKVITILVENWPVLNLWWCCYE